MIGQLRTVLIFSIVALALVVTGANYTKHQDVLRSLEQAQEEKKMQTMSSTWKSEGITMTLNTPRKDPETAAAHMIRHKESLTAAKLAFPVDPPAGG